MKMTLPIKELPVFGCVLQQSARGGLPRGKTIGIDSTTLEANAAMKVIVHHDAQARPLTGERAVWESALHV
ncbi:MAG TPA: hypothetical protein VEU11_04185 [Terriglobales bacterium]|nr:hypothetical protein [Terriglobales bacterium]